jgi:tRNA (cmo5U34)-methyltransferase
MKIPNDWTFNSAEIADAFDHHVREQLPWYDLTTNLVAHIARHYIPEGGRVYDIGASTGNIGRSISDTLEKRKAEFIAIESSKEMCEKYAGPPRVVCEDACSFEYKSFDLAICFLVLMFMTPNQRAELIQKLQRMCRLGGAIVIFDKLQPVSGYPATVLSRLTIAGKVASGAEPKDIIAKELSLAGAQRPLAPSEIPLGSIEVFRFGEFAGYLWQQKYPTAG